MIEFRGVRKSFGSQEVLRGLDLRIDRGEIVFIIGTSGVGKSVAIKHLVGLLRPDAGEVLFDGRPIQDLDENEFYPIRMRCGMVFQSATLFDSMTLLENVMLPLRKHRRVSDSNAEHEALRYLKIVHMEQFAARYPTELGDGLRKRAAIARTLALQPEVVLFDEPTTGLDPISARRIDKLVQDLSRDLGVTCVVVSHDLRSIFTVANRIVLLYEGRAHLVGTPEEFRQSADPVVKQFIEGSSQGVMQTPGF